MKEYLVQGGISIDYFTKMKGECEESAIIAFLSIFNPNDLKLKELVLQAADGTLCRVSVEGSEMEIDSITEVCEDMSKKHKNCQTINLSA